MSRHFDTDVLAKHLGGMVQFPTLSCAKEADIDFQNFYDFHKYLEETYPLLHKTLTKEIIGKAALLYHWKGTGKSGAKPILLMAHQDVVPEGNHADWKYPPYSGEYKDGLVWGRGSGDCKSHILVHMEAIEYLISQGFTPNYDIYLGYGYNEEVSGGDSVDAAKLIAGELVRRGIKIGYSFDEGGGVNNGEDKGLDVAVCSLSMGEKGYVDFEISRKDAGGHSMMPHKDSALVYVAKAILAIENNPFPYRVTEPIKNRFAILAPHYKEQNELTEILKDVEANFDKLVPYLDKNPMMAAMFRTTLAVTMAQGSAQANILPEKASFVVNSRLLPGDTIESVKAYLESIIPEGMEVTFLKGNNPSPFSDPNTDVMQLVLQISKELYGEDMDGKEMILLPDLILGGTDARYMYEAVEHVYRFGGMCDKPGTKGAHSVNETQDASALAGGAEFFTEFLLRYGK